MHRTPVSNDIDFSLFNEFLVAFVRDAPMAFHPESRATLLNLLDSPSSVAALQLAFDFDRGFRQVGRGLKKFAAKAKEARHVASEIAKAVDPIFEATAKADIPYLSSGAQLAHQGIRLAQKTPILEAASRDYM
jgi:hypothetical protein